MDEWPREPSSCAIMNDDSGRCSLRWQVFLEKWFAKLDQNRLIVVSSSYLCNSVNLLENISLSIWIVGDVFWRHGRYRNWAQILCNCLELLAAELIDGGKLAGNYKQNCIVKFNLNCDSICWKLITFMTKSTSIIWVCFHNQEFLNHNKFMVYSGFLETAKICFFSNFTNSIQFYYFSGFFLLAKY